MIIAGFGLRQAATLASLKDALEQALPDQKPDALAAPSDKIHMPALQDLAADLALPLYPVDQTDMSHTTTPTQAARVIELRGTGSVAEAAALIVAGQGARILCPRVVSTDRMATCATAVSGEPS